MRTPRLPNLAGHKAHPATAIPFELDIPSLTSVDFERVSEFSFSDESANSAQTGFVIVPAAESSPSNISSNAVILGVAKTALSEVVDHFRSSKTIFRGQAFRQAGAYYDSKGRLRAGIFPKDVSFGKLTHDDDPMCTVAMRQGPTNVYMTMGLVTAHRGLKAHRQMLIPKNVEIIEQNVPANEVSSRYPGVPLI